MPVMFDAEKLLTGARAAVLAPATIGDQYQISPGAAWEALNDLPLSTQVHAVNHFGKYTSQVGAITSIKSLNTGRRYDFQITAIYLVRCSDLTPQELAALGHADRPSFDAEFGAALGTRRAWFIELIPIATSAIL